MLPVNGALQYLATAYFHQDYQEEFGSAEGAVRGFKTNESPRKCAELLADIDEILSPGLTESGMEDLWGNEWDSMYEPERDGLTYRQWFTRVRELLLDRDK